LTIGAFLNNQLIGNLRFFQRNENHHWIKHIGAFGMAVLQEYWGQGLGSKMIQLMEEHAKKVGMLRIEAEVRTANVTGARLYQKHGFKIEGLREKATLINGCLQDEYYIAKIIT
jgi:RimJ/RimL family protein N-acetyltransferase